LNVQFVWRCAFWLVGWAIQQHVLSTDTTFGCPRSKKCVAAKIKRAFRQRLQVAAMIEIYTIIARWQTSTGALEKWTYSLLDVINFKIIPYTVK
jgi:hypothetical protein